MNTPRSKPPRRYRVTLKDTPEGAYTSGITNPAIATLVGLIITAWPHIEERAAVFFGELTEIEDPSSARLIFRSVINQTTRIAIMRAMLEKTPQHKDKTIWFDELIDEYAAVNTIRNKYAHSLWYTFEDNIRVFIEEETDTYHFFLDKREVDEKELKGVITRMGKLTGQFLDRQRRNRLIELLRSSPKKPPQPPTENSQELPNPGTKKEED